MCLTNSTRCRYESPSTLLADFCMPALLQLADLDDPLEDQEGFIYEGAAIREALRKATLDRCNWIECPLPGVSHKIMQHHLKPANKRRLQRMAKLKQQQQQQGTQAGHGRVVLDV